MLFLIAVLLANIHQDAWPFFFILFLPYIAEYILEKILKKKEFYKIKYVNKNNEQKLIIIFAICILSGFVTLKGLNCYTHLFKLLMGNSTTFIQEHEPLILAKNPYALIVISIVILEMFLPNIKYRLKDIFMLLGLIALSFITARQISMLVLIGGISMQLILIDILNKYNSKWKEKLNQEMTQKSTCFMVVLLVIVYGAMFELVKANDNYIDKNIYPVQATDWLKQNLDIKNIKLYNDYDFGSYLLFENIPVFIDSRADLYTPEFSNKQEDIFTDFFETTDMKTDYEETFKKYGITHVMLYNERLLTLSLNKDKNYKILYKDDIVTIFEKMN